MKVIIYARGQVFRQNWEKIDKKSVIAIADKKAAPGELEEGIPVITPNALNEHEFDYIAIFSNQLFESIKKELIGIYFIPEEKIIFWKAMLKKKFRISYKGHDEIINYIKNSNHKYILDVGMSFLPKIFLSQNQLFGSLDRKIDGIAGKESIWNNCLYNEIVNDVNELSEHYQMALLNEKEYNENFLEDLLSYSDGVMFFSQYLNMSKTFKCLLEVLKKRNWNIYSLRNHNGELWIAEKRKNIETDMAMYVVTHKEYNVKADELYKPICVGDYQKKGYLWEKDGDNISYLNKKINECTALYWIWKNTTEKYVGLNHYRRYFYNNSIKVVGNYLSMERIDTLLQEYDLILPETYPMEESRVERERLYGSMNSEAFEKGYALIKSGIAKHQPEYTQAFEDMLNGHTIFVCNMFVTKREILNEYCEWLFSFLIEAAEYMDVSSYDNYSQRVIGFFAERMWTVWLKKQRLKIIELPFDEVT